MAKKYNIQLSELEKLLDMLSSYDDGLFEDLALDIETLKIAIARLKNNFNVPSEYSLVEKMAIDLNWLGKYKEIYPHVVDLIKKGLYFSDAIDPKYNDVSLSDEDAIDICRDFYSKQGPFFSEAFEDYYKTAQDRLMFFPPNINSEGEIHYLQVTGDAFVLCPDYKDLRKASILIHEGEHVIDCFNNPSYYKNVIVREIGSTFMEMIGCDHLSKVLSLEEDGEIRKYHIHSIIKSAALYIPDKMSILDLLSNNKSLSEGKAVKRIRSVLGYDKEYVSYLFQSNIVEDYYYQVAYMVAIELYNIYINDKERALYILKDIIMNGNDDNIFNILKKHNICIGSNVVKYEDDMCLKLGI